MESTETILNKINIMLADGNNLFAVAYSNINEHIGSYSPYFKQHQLTPVFTWQNKMDIFIENNVPSGSFFHTKSSAIQKENHDIDKKVALGIQQRIGLLEALKYAIENGEMNSWQYAVSAEDFSGFLDHAKIFHKANKKDYAAVIASSVLEDTIKKIAKKSNIEFIGKTLSPLINLLKEAGVFNNSKAKQIESLAAIRNDALHASWENIDIKDVGRMIEDIEKLISDFLYEN